jgi:hypothetical protein
MPFVKINWRPNKRELRQFGAIFFAGFFLIGVVKCAWPFERFITRDYNLGIWLMAIGVVVGAIGATGSQIALPFYWAWLGIAFVVGNIMSRLIIALIYFFVFTPMRLLSIFLGRDRLQLRKPGKDTYWLDISLPKELKKYERQF